MRRVVIDTNVLFTGLRSRRGASYKLLSLLDVGLYQPVVSPPLFFEYAEVLHRPGSFRHLTATDIDNFLDALAARSLQQNIYFLWRPFLRDPKDDMVLELAGASQSSWIITYNLRDFTDVGHFGIQAITPDQFLTILRS